MHLHLVRSILQAVDQIRGLVGVGTAVELLENGTARSGLNEL